MTFLPIVERELRVAARRRGTFTIRYLSAGAIMVLWVVLQAVGRVPTSRRGITVFIALAIAVFLVSLITGVFLTADSVASERREGTLGLLFLTELRGLDVVLGKLVGTSIRAFYGLLSLMPVLALPLLTGGVTAGEFWRMVLVILSGLFLSLTIGLMMSVTCRDARSAMVVSFLSVLMLGGLPWALYWFGRFFFNLKTNQVDWLLIPSPVNAFIKSFSPFYLTTNGPSAFWASTGIMLGSGLLSLAIASMRIGRVWQNAGDALAKPAAVTRNTGLRYGDEGRRSAHRAWLILEPIYWLATRDRGPVLRLWWVFGPCLLIWFVFWFCFLLETSSSETGFICAFFIGYALHALVKGFVATEAARRLLEDRKSGALELLLVTPLPTDKIISGLNRAVNQMFVIPVVLLFLVNVALIAVALWREGNDAEAATIFILTFLAGTTLLVTDYFALRRVGMWMALRANRHSQAVSRTLRQIMLLPWLGFGIFFFMIFTGRNLSQASFVVMILVWGSVSVVISIVAGIKAQKGLDWRFREAVAGENNRKEQ